MITKPMLAGKALDLDAVKYPVLVTPKLDGIRCLTVKGKCVSRSFKPIANKFIREVIEGMMADGFDGELIVEGESFQQTTHAVMSEDGDPRVTYFVFDYVKDSLDKPYKDRMRDLANVDVRHMSEDSKIQVKTVLPVEAKNKEELQEYERQFIAEGYEGLMLRDPNGPYKCGRSTEKEGFLLKVKRFQDDEAKVISVGEKMHNENFAGKDAFGRTKRSTAKEGMKPAGTTGELVVKSPKWPNVFSIGTGLNDEMRAEIWKNRAKYIGKLVKFKHQPSGSKGDAPRFPVFLGFRSKDDL
jgi:DNA ligase-1